MTPEIKEGSIIMAHFMGAKTDYYPEGLPRHVDMFGTWESNLEDFQYHSCWSWFMPVWYKFRDIKFENDNWFYYRKHHQEYCYNIAKAITHASISDAFIELVDGIKWYNLNQQRQ